MDDEPKPGRVDRIKERLKKWGSPEIGGRSSTLPEPRATIAQTEQGRQERLQAARERIERISRVGDPVVRSAQKVIEDPVESIRDLADKSVSYREEFDQYKRTGRLRRWVARRVVKGGSRLLFGIPLEAPLAFGYGPGDILAAFNALTGRDIYTGGGRIDPIDRIIYGLGAVIPGVPATVVVEIADWLRFGFESILAHPDEVRKSKS